MIIWVVVIPRSTKNGQELKIQVSRRKLNESQELPVNISQPKKKSIVCKHPYDVDVFLWVSPSLKVTPLCGDTNNAPTNRGEPDQATRDLDVTGHNWWFIYPPICRFIKIWCLFLWYMRVYGALWCTNIWSIR